MFVKESDQKYTFVKKRNYKAVLLLIFAILIFVLSYSSILYSPLLNPYIGFVVFVIGLFSCGMLIFLEFGAKQKYLFDFDTKNVLFRNTIPLVKTFQKKISLTKITHITKDQGTIQNPKISIGFYQNKEMKFKTMIQLEPERLETELWMDFENQLLSHNIECTDYKKLTVKKLRSKFGILIDQINLVSLITVGFAFLYLLTRESNVNSKDFLLFMLIAFWVFFLGYATFFSMLAIGFYHSKKGQQILLRFSSPIIPVKESKFESLIRNGLFYGMVLVFLMFDVILLTES